jgi:hypothetical protein
MPGPFRTKRLNARNPMRGRTRSRTLGKSINRTRLRAKRLNARNPMRGLTRSRTLGQSINRTALQLRPDNLPFLPTHTTYESRDFARRRTPYRVMNRSRRTPYRLMNRSRREYPTEIRRPMYSPVRSSVLKYGY